MIRKEISIDQYNKLKDCIVTTMYGTTKRKFVKKNKRYTRVASLHNNTSVIQVLYRNSEVTIINH